MLQIEHDIVLKYCNSDFHVSEVSLAPDDSAPVILDNEHTILIVSKEGYTTFEAMQMLATFFGLERQDVHCQGLKDEDGVTEQLVSIKKIISSSDAERFTKQHAHLKKGWISISIRMYARSPVIEKSLHGNLFNVKLRNMHEAHADTILRQCKKPLDFVCANYYDQQRFGLPGGPFVAHKIGEAIISNDWQTANETYLESGNVSLDFPGEKPSKSQNLLIDRVDPRKLSFFVAAYNSYNWDQLLSEGIGGSVTMKIFDSHLVKIPAPKNKLPLLTSSTGYEIGDERTITSLSKARTSAISTTVFANNKQVDNYFPSKFSINLQFFLPAGSYATMLVKQFIVTALDKKL